MGINLGTIKYNNYGKHIGTSKSGISVFKSVEDGMTCFTSIKDASINPKGFWQNIKSFFRPAAFPIKEIFKHEANKNHPAHTTVFNYKKDKSNVIESFMKDKTKIIYKRPLSEWKPFFVFDNLFPKSINELKQMGKENKHIINV